MKSPNTLTESKSIDFIPGKFFFRGACSAIEAKSAPLFLSEEERILLVKDSLNPLLTKASTMRDD